VKTFATIVAALALARGAGAQTAPTTIAQPASTLEEVHNPELRIGLSSLSVLRSSVLDGAGEAHTTGSLTGVDLFARTQGIGVYARRLSGTFGTGSQGMAGGFTLEEARLVIGGPTLSVEAGAIRRTTSTLDDQRDQTFWRGGFRSNWDIGSSGVQVTLNAGGRFGKAAPSGTTTSLKFLGVDGEATLLVQAPRDLPIYGLVGWHYERFDDGWSMIARTEEISGPFFGIGFRLASKPFLR
jgi:hypothetical protein